MAAKEEPPCLEQGSLLQDERSRAHRLNLPLATRLRPQTLKEFYGNEGLFSTGAVFAEAKSDRPIAIQSLILWGPPGSGKTTLAHLLIEQANIKAHYLSAITTTLIELRAFIAKLKESDTSLLFIDEIHRFNKTQQDALLPVIESGRLLLIGATTENPYFELRKALISRCRVVRLEKLLPEHIKAVILRALSHPHGYQNARVEVTDETLDLIALYAGGDARSALNLLELAISRSNYSPEGRLKIDLSHLQPILQDQHLAYHKDSDRKRDLISAFIKSIRGSDPDAATYWLASMLRAGEDPGYIMRRLIIAASEDVGLADPSALTVVMSCASALEMVGMPEGKYALSQATLYLATANKSNSTSAIFRAEEYIQKNGAQEVPLHLRNGSYQQALQHGIGQGYLNPHSEQNIPPSYSYLPKELRANDFFKPSHFGYEKVIRQRIEHLQVKKGEQ